MDRIYDEGDELRIIFRNGDVVMTKKADLFTNEAELKSADWAQIQFGINGDYFEMPRPPFFV